MNKASQNTSPHGSVFSYTVGFLLSLALTLVPYFVVTGYPLSGRDLIIFLVACACAQLYVQLVFFLHLGKGQSRQLNLIVFGFMVLIVGTVVIGSIWIMNNLNYNMMSPESANSYMLEQVDKGF